MSCGPPQAEPPPAAGFMLYSTSMQIRLDKEQRAPLLAAIKEHVREQFDEEIGDMKAGFLLDFFIKRLGPPIYNQAIRDAQAYMQGRLVEMEDVLYQFDLAPANNADGE